MSSSLNLKDFRIPLKELERATCDFDDSRFEYGVYRGELSERWQNRSVFIELYSKDDEYVSAELEIVSSLHHEDIISFVGYCDEDDHYIYMVYEYFADRGNNSLDFILRTDMGFYLEFAARLEICIRVAKVLNYLHSGVGERGRVIHGDITCENILLNMDTSEVELIKVRGFKYSKLVPLNQPQQHHCCPEKLFKNSHTDPVYKETSLLNTESDVYSFGVLMFDILHGRGVYSILQQRDKGLHQLMNLVRSCYDDGPYKLVDPNLKGDFNHRSLQVFTTLAYKCISLDIKERPRMDEIIKTIEKALDIHVPLCLCLFSQTDGIAFTNTLEAIKKFEIPLEEIRKATRDFGRRGYSKNYKRNYRGQLIDRCKDREAFFKRRGGYYHGEPNTQKIRWIKNELLLISSFHHENITPFIGFYAKEYDDVIIASEYALNGSLYLKLETQNENSYLTWEERLKICLGAARGLKYYHAGFGEHKVIHGDFKSEKILLYDNLEAKICGFSKSFLVPRSHPDTIVNEEAQGSEYYMDPVYRESCIPRVESNVYSFGVVLFEVLTGLLACNHPVEDERISMINWVRRLYNDETDKLVDSRIRDKIDARSLHMLKNIAYKCISFNMKDRPSMNKIVKRLEEALYIQTHGAASTVARKIQKLEDFRIPSEEINLAINVEGQKIIGKGAFGVVYVGQLSERWQNRTVAIKYLYPKSDHEEHVFRNELNMIFSFSHENIIPFIGYCDKGKEKVIVYEFASNGSLDCHLENEDGCCLTWESRLKICLGAARGLEYLHSGRGEDENSVIHRDVKSGNILLDHNLVAKICDFGLSKAGPMNKLQTQVYTNIAGTNFYMDPVYHESGVLHKVSDVYSFGVVMFELLSGLPVYYRKSIGDSIDKLLLHLVRRYYDHKPELLIDPFIEDEIDNRSFNVYREVAYQCISFNSKERPTMEMIVDRVEEALELQVTNQGDLKQKVTKS